MNAKFISPFSIVMAVKPAQDVLRASTGARHHWLPRQLIPDTHCALCARAGQAGLDLCRSCQQSFKTVRYRDRSGRSSDLCAGCGEQIPVPTGANKGADEPGIDEQSDRPESTLATLFCSRCQGQAEPVFSHIVAPYRYAFPLNQLIKRVKYTKDRQLTRVLGHLLARAVRSGGGDRHVQALIPMPLHHTRLAERGFNQAQDIARWCGAELAVPVHTTMAQRIEATGSLAGLDREARRLRILGVFRASESVSGKRVAIVDDVMTTGASAGELARELYDSGAVSVELWVLARTSSVRDGV